MIYQHYKGALYKVMAFGEHTETGEDLVIYQDKTGKVWVRPAKMFLEKVVVDGKEMERFKFMGNF